MAKNLTELDHELKALEKRKQEQLALLKSEVDMLQESVKPGNLIRTAIKDLFANHGAQSFVMGVAGSALLGGKAGILKSLLSQLLTSDTVHDFIKNDKGGISKWLDKLKSLFASKEEDAAHPGQGE